MHGLSNLKMKTEHTFGEEAKECEGAGRQGWPPCAVGCPSGSENVHRLHNEDGSSRSAVSVFLIQRSLTRGHHFCRAKGSKRGVEVSHFA